MSRRAIIIVALTMIACFFFGRFSAPEKIKTVKETVTTSVNTQATDDKKDVEKIVTEIHEVSGKTITRTRYITKTEFIKEQSQSKETLKYESKTITNRRGVVVSALGGIDFSGIGLEYGVGVQKQILGPINVGVFGLSGKSVTMGVSLGFEF